MLKYPDTGQDLVIIMVGSMVIGNTQGAVIAGRPVIGNKNILCEKVKPFRGEGFVIQFWYIVSELF
jgi:hypothetical protein